MAEQADEQRLAELNAYKQEWEDRKNEESRRSYNPLTPQEQNDYRENLDRMSPSDRAEQEDERRAMLARQRKAEETETARRQSLQNQRETEESATRIAASRREYNVRKGNVPFEDLTPSEKAMVSDEVEKSRSKMTAIRQRVSDVRAGNIPFSDLNKQERGMVDDEVRGTYYRIAAIKEKAREIKKEDEYRRSTPLASQLKAKLTGDKDPWNKKPAPQVKPITSLFGAAKQKGKDIVAQEFRGLGAPLRDLQAGVKARGQARATGQTRGFLFGAGLQPTSSGAFPKGTGKTRRAPQGMLMGELKMFASPFNPRKKVARKKKGRKTTRASRTAPAPRRTLFDNILW